MRTASTVKTIDYKDYNEFNAHRDTMHKNGWWLKEHYAIEENKYKYCAIWIKGPCV